MSEKRSFLRSSMQNRICGTVGDALDEAIFAAQLEERQRLAGDLHDSVGQELVALSVDLSRLRAITGLPSESHQIMDAMSHSLQRAHSQIRTLSFLLQAPWEGETYEVALRDLASGFARRGGLDAAVHIPALPSALCETRKLALFRTLQEALVNVHRHAQATTISVELAQRGVDVVLTVQDNGRGMPNGAAVKPGVGIKSMRHRLRRLGGDLRIVSNPSGTTIKAQLPIHTRPAQTRNNSLSFACPRAELCGQERETVQ